MEAQVGDYLKGSPTWPLLWSHGRHWAPAALWAEATAQDIEDSAEGQRKQRQQLDTNCPRGRRPISVSGQTEQVGPERWGFVRLAQDCHKSSIKLKVSHPNSNQKGGRGAFPGAAVSFKLSSQGHEAPWEQAVPQGTEGARSWWSV